MEMKKQLLIFLVLVFIEFMIGTLVGENKGTAQSFMFWPIIITTGFGLGYFLVWIIKGSNK